MLGEVDGVGVIRLDASYAFAARRGVIAAAEILERLTAGVEQPLRRAVIPAAVGAGGHDAKGDMHTAPAGSFEPGIDRRPVEFPFFRLDVHPEIGRASCRERV